MTRVRSYLSAGFSRISRTIKSLTGRRGAVLPLVAILMFVLLAFAAFAVDLGYLHVVRNELQNAADAGALAGAGVLFDSHGNLQDYSAVIEPTALATTAMNTSGGEAVNASGSNNNFAVNVAIGHYSFASSSFTQITSGQQMENWTNLSFSCLDNCTNCPASNPDACSNFINAVQVTVSRNDVPAFFSKILGYSQLAVTNVKAVAYVGFAGTLSPATANEPIAICKQSIQDVNGSLTCSDGRMINSSPGSYGYNTGGWTDFTQPTPCTGAAAASSVKPLICADGNPNVLVLGRDLQTTGGEVQSVFGNNNNGLYSCWLQNSNNGTQPWMLTLPVIDCPGNNVTGCARMVGAVDVYVVWIWNQTDPHMNNAPTQMADAPPTCTSSQGNQGGTWTCASSSSCQGLSGDQLNLCCWNSFVSCFDLRDANNNKVTIPPYQPSDLQKTLYFLPSCTPHDPEGQTGGENFGILARYPVLVK